MKKILFLLLSICLSCTLIWAQDVPTYRAADIHIPYKRYVLPNGLRLVVHEDPKAPIVAVNVWYHVGSKNEKPGKSGFAHLFEHLMFNGSENFNNDYFQALERIGATDLNGTTNNDRTNYFQNVPVGGLDQVLFLESDRMGYLLGAIDQAKLDEQRGVVQNEKREGENSPYGIQWDLITKHTYPKGHPYSWTVIGEMEDLNAASLDDVKEWFKAYYGAANAVLVIAGDVKADEIHEKVKKYFGTIPSGPTLTKPEVDIAKRTGESRAYYQDRVPEARINMVWNVPQWGDKQSIYLDLIADILASGKSSRLFKKLVYTDQTATQASAFNWTKEISGNFVIQANVKPGQSVAKVEGTINDLLKEFLENGPTEQELARVKASYFANFIKGLERIGGFGGKSDILAENEVFGGSPEYYKTTLGYVENATIADLKATAREWLSDGKFVLVCEPFPSYTTIQSDLDRTKMPEIGPSVAAKFPELQRATLKNGMKIVLARRPGVPTVVMDMLFDAGYASDQFSKLGTAALAMNMMDEGTKTMDALAINERLQVLGASLSASSDLDMSYIGLNTLKPSLDPSLDLLADVVLNPSFPENEFSRLKQQQIAGIQREKSQPVQMALRVFPKLMYGDGHAYSAPLSGSGTEETVASITRDDVLKFYNTWIRPNNVTITVVGDIEMKELTEKLEKRFANWKKGEIPTKNIATAKQAKGNVLYLMDRPQSQQSVIFGGYLIDPYGKVSEVAKNMANNVLGGEFTSRLNMNLREDKHWAYGAFTLSIDAKGQRPFLAYAPVQTDKTKESVQEIIKELKGFVGGQPITAEEFEKTKTNAVLQLPGGWETNDAVSGSLNEIVKYGLPDNYYQTYDQRVRNLTIDEVKKVSQQIVRPDQLSFMIVGDKEKILPTLTELGFSQIILLDADGKPLTPSQEKLQGDK